MEYFLGLDIGTTSVGWAVTNKNYDLLRTKGQDLWGVRLFDEAVTAVDRRIKRNLRRNRARKKLMIRWLQEIFAPEVKKIDSSFFIRLNNSSFWKEDKDDVLDTKDSVFTFDKNGNKYTDKDFYKEYKSIFHLRSDLIKNPANDVRFLYLALHNLIKSRGHFYSTGGSGENGSLKECFNSIVDFIEQEEELEVFKPLNSEKEKLVLKVICENLGIKRTLQSVLEIFEIDKSNKRACAIVNACLSGKIGMRDIKVVFNTEKEVSSAIVFSSQEEYDSNCTSLKDVLSEKDFELLGLIKQCYDTILLKKIIKDDNYICDAMVSRYNLHHQQLAMFKRFIKEFYPDFYSDMFKNPCALDEDMCGYAVFVGKAMKGGKKLPINVDKDGKVVASKRTQESFYKYINFVLKNEPAIKNGKEEEFEKQKTQIVEQMDNDVFLTKQRIGTNSVIPNTLLLKEMNAILENNKKYYLFLQNIDESGLSNCDKIKEIMKFRVPYFVGPISTKTGKDDSLKNQWAIVNPGVDFKPWNLKNETLVDFDAAEEEFIRRMTNKCSYILNADVLPKNSILFCKYKVLNELNKLKVNGANISVNLKQEIYENIFLKKLKVTIKDIEKYLKIKGEDIINISLANNEAISNMSVLVNLEKMFGERIKNTDFLEDVIFYHTIMQDKNRIVRRLNKKYDLTEIEQKRVKSLNYAGWGSFSKQLLENTWFADLSTGEKVNLIQVLWETNLNFQEILFSENYTLKDVLKEQNQKIEKEISYGDLENSYCSAPVKRSVWQTVKIINELKKILGEYPAKIFVEVTKDDEENPSQKLSRKNQLQKLFVSKEAKECFKNQKEDLEKIINELNKYDNADLRSEKLYLYFLQQGKCAYSGKTIDIKNLNDDSYCDIDHIIPRSFIKDDSMQNKVLVLKEYNSKKSDNYPVPQEYQNCKWLWTCWLKQGLMTEKKYQKLIRVEPLTPEDKAGFISRQIVETNQSAKMVTDLLRRFVKDDKDVVFSKASLVSAFRQDNRIYKAREINDYHHAKDAYLNIVVGNGVRVRYSDNPINFFRRKEKDVKKEDEETSGTTNPIKIFDYQIKDWTSKEIVWNGRIDKERIKKVCQKNSPMVSFRSYEKMTGNFYKATVYKSVKNCCKTNAKIQLKGKGVLSNIEKYGGYDNQTNSYFILVESGKEGKRKKTLEVMTLYTLKNILIGYDTFENYLTNTLKLVNPIVLIDKIKLMSTIHIGKGEFLISGKGGTAISLHNFNEWNVKPEIEVYAKILSKYSKLKQSKINLEEKDGKVILAKSKKSDENDICLCAEKNIFMYKEIQKQLNKKFYDCVSIRSSVSPVLEENFEKFLNLSIMEQADLLNILIKCVSRGADIFNLELIGGTKACGRNVLGENVTGKNVYLIKKSVLGFVTNKIYLG